METTIEQHLRGWGMPDRYCHESELSLSSVGAEYDGDPIPSLMRAVSTAANWYYEQDAVLAEMVRNGDADALREWDRDRLREIGIETGDDDEDGIEYADRVSTALDALADAIEDREDEDFQARPGRKLGQQKKQK